MLPNHYHYDYHYSSLYEEYIRKMQDHLSRYINNASISPKEKAEFLNSRGITNNGKPFKEEDFNFGI